MAVQKAPQLPRHVRYLCVEGVLGVGKTALCNLLSRRLGARFVLEEGEQNPFLPKFYRNRKSFAFQTQLWFLLSRYRQLSETFTQLDLFQDVSILDYMFAKDKIFASINLDENELALYGRIAAILERTIPAPDYVVYLQASTDVLLKRIEKRGRPFESSVDKDYIDLLNQGYNHFFFHYTGSPLLIINTNDIDFVEYEGDLDELVREICKVSPGSNYYQPLDSKTRSFLDNKKKTEL
jgi:deoxyadenosine/deoxycytidine kinase